MTTTAERTYTATQVVDATGITYRQLDHWAADLGLLSDNASGCGSRRTFTADDLLTVHAVSALIESGFEVRPAFAIARALRDRGTWTHTNDIYTITVAVTGPTREPT